MKRLLRSVLAKAGYRVECTRFRPRQLVGGAMLRALEFDDLVCRRMAEVGPQLRFVQIGVYDGVTHDPLHKYIRRFGWRGVLVEPQGKAAQILVALYRDYPNISVVQAALDAAAGQRTLYTVAQGECPAWAGGLASFQRETILKHAALIPGLEELLREEIVPCVTFDHVLNQLEPGGMDILQIDTEGADGFILSLFPFEREARHHPMGD